MRENQGIIPGRLFTTYRTSTGPIATQPGFARAYERCCRRCPAQCPCVRSEPNNARSPVRWLSLGAVRDGEDRVGKSLNSGNAPASLPAGPQLGSKPCHQALKRSPGHGLLAGNLPDCGPTGGRQLSGAAKFGSQPMPLQRGLALYSPV